MSTAHGLQILSVPSGLCGRGKHGGVGHAHRCRRSKGYGHVPRQQRLLPVQRRTPAQPIFHTQLYALLERRASAVQHGHLHGSHDTGEYFLVCGKGGYKGLLHTTNPLLYLCTLTFPSGIHGGSPAQQGPAAEGVGGFVLLPG